MLRNVALRAVTSLTVRDVATRYGVDVHTVLHWIDRGELRAVNVARRPGGKRPRWRISEAALHAFETGRAATPAPARRRPRKRQADVIEFYSA